MNIPLNAGSVNLPPSSSISSPALTLAKKKIHTLLLLRFSTLGCLLESLQDEYLTYFDQELNPSSFGFSSLMEMLDSMPKEVCVSDMKDRSSKVVHPQPLNHKKTVELIKIIFPMTNPMELLSTESNENVNNLQQQQQQQSTNNNVKSKSIPALPPPKILINATTNGVGSEALLPVHQDQSQGQGSSEDQGQGQGSKRGGGRRSTRGRRLRLSSKEDNIELDNSVNSSSASAAKTPTANKRPLNDTLASSEKESGNSGAVNTSVSSPQSKRSKKKTVEEPIPASAPAPIKTTEITIKTEPVSPAKETGTENLNTSTSKSHKKKSTPSNNNKEQTFTLSSRRVLNNNEKESPSKVNGGELMMETETDKNGPEIDLNIVRWNASLNGKVLKLGGSEKPELEKSKTAEKSDKSEKSEKTETSSEKPENMKIEPEMVGNRRQSSRARRTIEQFDASPLPPMKKTEPKKVQFSSTDMSALPEIFMCIEEELREKRCTQAMEKAWLTIFDMAIVNPDTELLLKTSELFIKCHEEFPTKTNLTEYMMGALGNIIMNEDINLRKTLMASTQVPRVLFEFLETPRFTRGNLKMKIEFSVVELLMAFLSDGEELWKLEEPSRETVCSMIWDTIEKWDVNTYLIINEFHYNSLVTNVKFLQLNHTPVCQLWSAWTLANFFIARPELYVKLLQDAHGEKELDEIVSNCKDETIVKYAKVAIEAMKKWLERD